MNTPPSGGFSFGTDDLTQTALGMSRDDSGTYLPAYAELEIVKKNPFATIDRTGVGQLIKIAVEKGNQTRSGIEPAICGEHGGDPESLKFYHCACLTYVSCSPRGRASRVGRGSREEGKEEMGSASEGRLTRVSDRIQTSRSGQPERLSHAALRARLHSV